MDTYENDRFKEFKAKGTHIANKTLRKPILRLERTSSLLGNPRTIHREKSTHHTNSLFSLTDFICEDPTPTNAPEKGVQKGQVNRNKHSYSFPHNALTLNFSLNQSSHQPIGTRRASSVALKPVNKVKFPLLAVILKWLVNRSNIDHPDLVIANKYLDSLKKAGGSSVDVRKHDQSKRNAVAYVYIIDQFS